MNKHHGFSLVEILIGLTLGLIITASVLGVFLSQFKIYQSNTSQATIQNAESAISALIIPTIRSAGYMGCASISQTISNLIPGGAAPIGALGTTAAMIMGYDAIAGTTINITQNNAPNSSNTSHWSPTLETSLQGEVQTVSDVLVVLGASPGSIPIAVTAITSGSNSLTLQNASGIAAGQFAAISDCSTATVFNVTGVVGTTITHASGASALANASDALSINYPVGSQFISLTQTAFFVANDPSGQSSLVRATFNTNGTWTIQSMVPGVQSMQVLYGIGTNGSLSQYVAASAVADWSRVYAIRLGFLIAGAEGSATLGPSQHNVIGSTVSVPDTTHLRHVFEITINLRNSNS